MPVPNKERPRLRIIIGGKNSIAPLSYRPYTNWTKGKLAEFSDHERIRAIERFKINNGLQFELTIPQQPDPDPAA